MLPVEPSVRSVSGARWHCECSLLVPPIHSYVSDEIRLAIGSTCSHLVVHTLRQFYTDRQVFVMVLRSIGNLSLCDENVFPIMDQGSVPELCKGVSANMADAEVCKMAADVLKNLACTPDPPQPVPLPAAQPSQPPMPAGGAAPPNLPRPPSMGRLRARRRQIAFGPGSSQRHGVKVVLQEQGGTVAGVELLRAHITNEDVATSALSMLYVAAARFSWHRGDGVTVRLCVVVVACLQLRVRDERARCEADGPRGGANISCCAGTSIFGLVGKGCGARSGYAEAAIRR